jgi:N-acetylneuraminate lyase
MTQFSGAWPALLTPFTAQDEVNGTVLREVVDYLIAQDIGGFYVCGSTGEGIYMSVAERQLVTETVIDQVKGRVPVIVHVGAVAYQDAAKLAGHAEACGADGVASIIPPLYTQVASIAEYFDALSKAAPKTPLLSYIFGGPTDAVALMRTLMKIPTVAGSKYTGPNMHEFRQIVDLGTEYQGTQPWTVFSGMDEECYFAALFGASGNIGSTLNYIPGMYREIHAARAAGDVAKGTELQLQANQITSILFSFGFMGALKEVMFQLGLDCGQPRLPNRPFDRARRDDLRAQLEAVNFFELARM